MKRHRTHRRILALLIALALCAALLVGCDGAPSGPVYTFTEFLDREGFTEHLHQMDIKQKMKTYTVDGETLWDLVGDAYMCGDVSNMLFGWGELYGYEHSSSTYEDHSSGHYSVYTSVLFDGFVLPYGLTFGDSLDTVSRRLELASSPLKNFAPDDADVPYRMTVREDGDTSLVFENLLLDPNVSKTAYPFTLTYKETSEETNEAGERVEIWREVKLSFDGDARLGRIAFERGQIRTFAAEEGTPE